MKRQPAAFKRQQAALRQARKRVRDAEARVPDMRAITTALGISARQVMAANGGFGRLPDGPLREIASGALDYLRDAGVDLGSRVTLSRLRSSTM